MSKMQERENAENIDQTDKVEEKVAVTVEEVPVKEEKVETEEAAKVPEEPKTETAEAAKTTEVAEAAKTAEAAETAKTAAKTTEVAKEEPAERPKKPKKPKQPAIVVKDVSMRFNLSKEKVDSLKDYVIKLFKRELHYNEFWALKHVDFTINKGDRVGILGMNGAGKSTLLKVIAGVFKPTEGSVQRYGRIVPLLELGAGFDAQYTGRENIYLYGAVLGYSKEFIDSKFQEILEFSELEEFIDVPLKNYSSGMKSRLGFSIATVVAPEILILDEVLSVGDAKFKKKSEKKVMDMFDSGVTVLFVSHSLAQVKRLCNKAIILEKGQVVDYGGIGRISKKYKKMIEAD